MTTQIFNKSLSFTQVCNRKRLVALWQRVSLIKIQFQSVNCLRYQLYAFLCQTKTVWLLSALCSNLILLRKLSIVKKGNDKTNVTFKKRIKRPISLFQSANKNIDIAHINLPYILQFGKTYLNGKPSKNDISKISWLYRGGSITITPNIAKA